jgi:hypothetical protein
MDNCPCCGYPGPAPNDDAFWLRYRFLIPAQKAALRKMAEAIIEAEAQPARRYGRAETDGD